MREKNISQSVNQLVIQSTRWSVCMFVFEKFRKKDRINLEKTYTQKHTVRGGDGGNLHRGHIFILGQGQ